MPNIDAIWSNFLIAVFAGVIFSIILYPGAGQRKRHLCLVVLAVAGAAAAGLSHFHLAPLIMAALLFGLADIAIVLGWRRTGHSRLSKIREALSGIAMLGITSLVLFAIHTYIRIHTDPSERFLVREQIWERPNDPWPRGTGHVPLSIPGAAAMDKAYMEPGGSFSPAVGSFGLSVWVRDKAGRLIATSDSIPLRETFHSYSMDAQGRVSATARTTYYTMTWLVGTPGTSGFHLTNLHPGKQTLELTVRSVGPAGAPVRQIRRSGDTLEIGDDWRLELSPGTRMVAMGSEQDRNWLSTTSANPTTAISADGWAFARIIEPGAQWTGQIARKHSTGERLAMMVPSQRPRITVPDEDFRNSLDAQTTTLLISLVGQQTRPGEPVNYPLAWQRDASYVLVALARAGQTEIARKLAIDFARTDFFGGFGAEADAPGLSLWALGEVSVASDDEAFTRAIWPDVVRKVALIEKLRRTQVEVRADYRGPVVPERAHNPDLSLVAEPARGGLINGRMDWQRPIFFINAMSFAGLNAAADIAEKLGHQSEAALWRTEAVSLRNAWIAAYSDPKNREDVANVRTAISGLWPADIAPAKAYETLLDQRWKDQRQADGTLRDSPAWTYFTVAEAHQWLRLGRAERVWPTIHQLWASQPIPGLFTLWEGKEEVNTFGLWQKQRGWIKPPNVTPHYWSAAEMLLLQLEMLAYADRSGVVIGSGIPAAWLAKPFTVERVQTGAGPVSYSWDGQRLTVHLPMSLVHRPVKLGQAFPAGTSILLR